MVQRKGLEKQRLVALGEERRKGGLRPWETGQGELFTKKKHGWEENLFNNSKGTGRGGKPDGAARRGKRGNKALENPDKRKFREGKRRKCGGESKAGLKQR